MDPRLSTSQPYAARAVGWEGIACVALWFGLADRDLAQKVCDRWLARARNIVVPRLSAMSGGIWDPRRDDRLGPGMWWIPWQQAVGSYGLDLAGEVFLCDEARQLALAAALVVLEQGWMQVRGSWVAVPVKPVDATYSYDESYNDFGMPLGIATILRHDPQHAQARAIWTQLAQSWSGRWTPPELVTPPSDASSRSQPTP